jgi:hypothetical protein
MAIWKGSPSNLICEGRFPFLWANVESFVPMQKQRVDYWLQWFGQLTEE